jgi:non-ribosomal peptide synthetase component E (peptide arylation enzyme)
LNAREPQYGRRSIMTAVSRYTPEMISSYVEAGYWTPQATVDYWNRNAQLRPDLPALADGRATYTWSEGARAVEAIAGGLVEAGIPRDGVLLVQAPNSALLVLFRLACESAGILPAFLHTGFRRSEIEAVARKVHPVGALVAAIGKSDLLPLYEELKPELGLRRLFSVEPHGGGYASLARFAAAAAPSDAQARRIRPYDMTGIVTSSGTTGLPKCIEYSCWPRLASGRVYIERLKITQRDVILTCIPFYTGGGDMQFHAAPQAGARFIVSQRFVPEEVCALIAQEGVTGAVMVPTMIARILRLERLKDYDFSSLRWVVSGGGMLPYDVGARFEDATGAKIIQGYGLMDYGALASHGVDDPREARLRSNGRLLPGTELRILGEDGGILPHGVTGQIQARGPHCNGGYIGDADGMRTAWRDGFFCTGDLGHITPEGWLVLEGRSKDIIIRGGQNISAFEVETILCRHPSVADAAVVRIADEEMGERACAFVVLRDGAKLDFAQMVAFMQSQQIADYKVPERLECVAEFPMTAAGNKVNKRVLEQRLKETSC